MMSLSEDRRERFNVKVDRSGGPDACWPWLGAADRKSGHGRISKPTYGESLAHRVAWILEHGEPPSEKPHVLHSCDNPPCCNPAHLFVGTHADNMRDAKEKGRMCGGRRRAQLQPRGEATRASKLTDDAVLQIRSSSLTYRALAQLFDVSHGTIGFIRRRKTWTHI